MQIHIADFHVFDVMAGNAADDGRQLRGIVAGDIADEDALELAHWACLGSAHASPRRRNSGEVVTPRMVMPVKVMSSHMRAVHGFKCQSVAVFEDAVRDGDVAEAAIGFGAALDAAGV